MYNDIVVFEKAKGIKEHDLFMATKGSVEGRDKATLKNQSDHCISGESTEQKIDTIKYLLKNYQDKIPLNVIDGIYTILDKFVLHTCYECFCTFDKHSIHCKGPAE